MSYYDLSIPPGVWKNGTASEAGGRWFDANLVRWFNGRLRPIGGWERTNTGALTGTARSIVAWKDTSGFKWIAVGTHSKLYIFSGTSGSASDITPTSPALVVGNESGTQGLGYGAADYGEDNYGDARTQTGLVIDATTWAFDTFGQILIALSRSDGYLLYWDPSATNQTTVKAARVPNAPSSNKGMVVSFQRHLFALGAGGDPKKVQWSDIEDYDDWTVTATNEAGDFLLDTQGEIVGGVKVQDKIIVLTNQDAHLISWIGPPYIYNRVKAGDQCGAISPQCMAAMEGNAYWMGDSGFFMWDGYTRRLECDVNDYIFKDKSATQDSKIYAVTNKKFGEIWWFYCSTNSSEIDRYVIFSQKEGWWSIGQLDRTIMMDSDPFKRPVAIGSDKFMYEHEMDRIGSSARADSVSSPSGTDTVGLQNRVLSFGLESSSDVALQYATTGNIELGKGDRTMHATQMVTDHNAGTNGVRFKFTSKRTPDGPSTTTSTVSPQSDGYSDIRFSGRSMQYHVEAPFDQDFEVGKMRIDLRPGGKR